MDVEPGERHAVPMIAMSCSEAALLLLESKDSWESDSWESVREPGATEPDPRDSLIVKSCKYKIFR